jgi:hypothetical protein
VAWPGRMVLTGLSGVPIVIERAVGARPGRFDVVVPVPGFGIVAVSGAVGLAGGSAALASRGFDEAVDLAVAAFDVGP